MFTSVWRRLYSDRRERRRRESASGILSPTRSTARFSIRWLISLFIPSSFLTSEESSHLPRPSTENSSVEESMLTTVCGRSYFPRTNDLAADKILFIFSHASSTARYSIWWLTSVFRPTSPLNVGSSSHRPQSSTEKFSVRR